MAAAAAAAVVVVVLLEWFQRMIRTIMSTATKLICTNIINNNHAGNDAEDDVDVALVR